LLINIAAEPEFRRYCRHACAYAIHIDMPIFAYFDLPPSFDFVDFFSLRYYC